MGDIDFTETFKRYNRNEPRFRIVLIHILYFINELIKRAIFLIWQMWFSAQLMCHDIANKEQST